MPTIKRSTERPWVSKQKGPNDHRGNNPFYRSKEWKMDRAARRREPENNLCVECRKKGIIKYGPVEDHIIPISQGGDPWDWANRQALCYHHHAVKSGKEKK